ncbi:ABC transporter substrate-binding protein, partial [Thermodesulfobacteriota bacterium]
GERYYKFKEMGLLADLSDIIKDTGYPIKFCSKDLDALSVEHTILGTAYNTNLVSPQDVPQSWEDLLDPKWKGRINVEPRMQYWIYATAYWGEAKIVDYLRKLSKQNPIFVRGDTQSATLLAAGEFPITVSAFFHRALIMKDKGAPVDWIPLGMPVIDKSSIYSIMRHAPHPNVAKLFLRWWMSPDGAAYVDARRHKGNPVPGSGTLTSKLFEKLGYQEFFSIPVWNKLDIAALTKKYNAAVGYTKEKERKKKKKK